jgi:hypothetical protein
MRNCLSTGFELPTVSPGGTLLLFAWFIVRMTRNSLLSLASSTAFNCTNTATVARLGGSENLGIRNTATFARLAENVTIHSMERREGICGMVRRRALEEQAGQLTIQSIGNNQREEAR